jgi:uncharacterized repeat protein (TIGR03806 family)
MNIKSLISVCPLLVVTTILISSCGGGGGGDGSVGDGSGVDGGTGNGSGDGAGGSGSGDGDDGAGGSGNPDSGLDSRPSSVACMAGEEPSVLPTAVGYGTENISQGAPAFSDITKIIQAPNDSSRWFVLEQGGRIMTFNTANPSAAYQWLQFSVSTNGENGLLSMAFHPNYPGTPEVFVYYVDGSGSNLVRVRLDNIDNPVSPDIDVLMNVSQSNDFHNGGDLAFDASNNLYWSLGDGLSSGQAQATTSLYGSVLRIEIPTYPSTLYSIPSANPFFGNAQCGPSGATGSSCPEIWAWGMRNPWRVSVDGDNLWVGDVGQGDREEVDQISISSSASNNNYGWPCFEGNLSFDPNIPACLAGPTLQPPLLDYTRADGSSITGGYVYRGSSIPALVGRYVFADFVSGRVWATHGSGKEELLSLGEFIPSLARGSDGEVYIADRSNGRVLQLTGNDGGSGGNDVPDNLADTGCLPNQSSSGLIPYDTNAPFWSDGATKRRYMAIPPSATVDITSQNDFSFPRGAVLVKEFRLNGQLIETRLLMRHTNDNGPWAGYTYEWNDSQTAATRVRDTNGKSRNVNGQDWVYPGENQCLDCHTSAADFALGPEVAQLNSDMTYSATGRTANQLETLDAIDVFSLQLPDVPENLPALVDPTDIGASLDEQARAILHTNCANCHRPENSAVQSTMDLRYSMTFSQMLICNQNSLQSPGSVLLIPGNAAESLLVDRMNRRDSEQMPPLASNEIDSASVNTLSNWINGMSGC